MPPRVRAGDRLRPLAFAFAFALGAAVALALDLGAGVLESGALPGIIFHTASGRRGELFGTARRGITPGKGSSARAALLM